MNPAILISGTGRISAILDGRAFTVETDHPNYSKILEAVKAKNWKLVQSLTDVAKSVARFVSKGGNGVEIKNGQVFYNGEVIHNTITKRIINFMREGLPFEPLCKFLNNLMENPSKRAVDELYSFLEVGELPITEDGCFLAYKKVRADYKDIHSGTFDNSVGAVCEMPRNRVDEDKERTCSSGLHFCSKDYLPHFGGDVSEGYHIMIVKINPRDVVAIPADYNDTKGRTCRYEVVGELNKDEWLKSNSLYSNNSTSVSPAYEYDNFDDYDDDYDDKSDYGVKPSGHSYYKVRDSKGRFVKKNR